MDPAPASHGDSVITAVVFLIVALASAFVFAGTETAITSMGELRLRRLLDEGRGPRKWLELWQRDPSAVLTTLLAGNTLANILASSITTSLTLELAHRHGLPASWLDGVLALAIGVLTLVILIGGEIAPKTLAKNHPEWFLGLMHVVWAFHLATRWLTAATTWSAMHIVRWLGGPNAPSGFQVTEEQIEDMVRIGSESGSIDEVQGDMLQSVFDLTELPVRQIMTPRTQIDAFEVETPYEAIAVEVTRSRWSRYPVYEKTVDKIIGVFYAKDLIDHVLRFDDKPFVLREHLREARYVPENKKASELLKEFRQHSVHMSVVVDEHGGTAGVVTMEDVLEELVGEIYDESDEKEAPMVEVSEGSWTVDASVEIRDFADKFGFELPENPQYATVGGLVIDQLGHVPQVGEELQARDLTLRVLNADETRVVRVHVERTVRPASSVIAV